MKLVVRVIEAKNLVATNSNGLSDLYVRLKLGKQRYRTKVIKKNMKPMWDEQFSFWVDDLKETLVVSVMDEDKFFNNDLLGRIKLPVSLVFDEEIKSLGNAWYSLKPKNKKSKNKQCGMYIILYIILLIQLKHQPLLIHYFTVVLPQHICMQLLFFTCFVYFFFIDIC